MLRVQGPGGTAGVAFYDDTRAMDETAYAEADGCDAYDGTECYAYDATRGAGYMRWAWNDCCTDGMVYGPLPPTGFCFQALVQSAVGLDAGVRLGTAAYNTRGDLPSGAFGWNARARGENPVNETRERSPRGAEEKTQREISPPRRRGVRRSPCAAAPGS